MNLIYGFTFAGYRSFPSDNPAQLFPLRKVNLIVGQNNSGKSNILRVIARTYGEEARDLDEWDFPLGKVTRPFTRTEMHRIDDILRLNKIKSLPTSQKERLSSFLTLPGIVSDLDSDFVEFAVTDRGQIDFTSMVEKVPRAVDNEFLSQLSLDLFSSSSSDAGSNTKRILTWIAGLFPPAPNSFTIDGVRTISSDSDQEPDLNGLSIKRRLLQLQNPATADLKDRDLFDKVQDFVRAVMDDPTITINVPHDLSTIHITQQGRTLPMENIGTGVHEVIIIAAAATVTQDSILCIEEPEVHLHPILQRKLLRYLDSNTTNQYFIATHSAHMLDSEIGSIFHVSRENAMSSVRFAGAARDRAEVCSDLGYRPSDLVQTNAVLWVEGPSDRIYLRHWIEQLAPGEFIEGTHYSVMFYGGALLSELSPLDAEEVEEFISLRGLNRYMLVLIDSDKKSASDHLNFSKNRVIKDLENDPSTGRSWVTAGYTIENYVTEIHLTSAIHQVHPKTTKLTLAAQTQWSNPLDAGRLGIKQPSKVAIAKKATSSWQNDWPFDLKERVNEVIALIREANTHM